MRKSPYNLNSDYVRNLMFGAEDSLVSTVGFLFGLASSPDYTTHLLVFAGIVLITVEGLSMGVGSYLSETEIHEIEGKSRHKDSTIVDGLLMFLSYVTFGILVLLPYTFLEIDIAKYASVIFTFMLLFVVGFLPRKKIKNGLRMLILGGLAIGAGFAVANMF